MVQGVLTIIVQTFSIKTKNKIENHRFLAPLLLYVVLGVFAMKRGEGHIFLIGLS